MMSTKEFHDDMKFEVAEIFRYRKRNCVIVKAINVHARIAPSGSYHNGYVSVIRKNNGSTYSHFSHRINAAEIAYSGFLRNLPFFILNQSIWFFGFDTAHFWNGEHPSSQTFKSVKRKTMELADEMIKKRI